MKSDKENILVLTDWFVPGYKAGGPIRSVFNMVSNLAGDFHFSILTSDRDLLEKSPYPGIQPDVWINKDGYRVMYTSPQKRKQLLGQEILDQKYSKVYLNSFFSKEFTIKPLLSLWLKGQENKVVLAPRGMLGEGALAIKPVKKRLFISLFRAMGLHRKATFHSTDKSETKSIEHALGRVQLIEASNLSVPVLWEPKGKTSVPSFLYASRISPIKNLLFLIERLKKIGGDITFSIAGPEEDLAYLSKCTEALEGMKGAKIVGPVAPDDLFQLYRSHDFFVLPTANENFGHAIIEALAHGCPAIISDQTPWNDLKEKGAGWAIPLSNPKEWETVLTEAMEMSEAKYAEMSQKAMEYVAVKFDIEEIRQQYSRLFA